MQSAAVVVKVGEELLGGDVGVKRTFMAKVAVPEFVYRFANEFCSCPFGRFEGCKVPEENGVLGLSTSSNDGCSRVIDDGVCWRASGMWER